MATSNDKPARAGTLHALLALASDLEAARLAMEAEADDYLTELEEHLTDAHAGVSGLLAVARAATEAHGVRFADWVRKGETALSALGTINAHYPTKPRSQES